MSKKKKSKTKGNKMSARQLQTLVWKFFKRHPKKRFTAKQIIQKLKIDNNKDSVLHAIKKLEEKGQVRAMDDNKFKLIPKAQSDSGSTFHEGVVDMTKSGSAYIVCDDLEDDVHVSAKYIGSALNGDRVRVRAWTPRGRRRAEGEIVEVLERARDHFMGTVWHYPKHAIVVPDGILSLDINVAHDDLLGAGDGDKVVVRVVDWEDKRFKGARGEITSVLGAAGSNDIEMKSILLNNGFNLDFTPEVLKESGSLPTEVTDEEIALRRDLRKVTTFTIDPDTAKDFDDALSIQFLENGDCEIGVHIADVTHYVRSGSALDKEAFERSTSVYLVDRVLPMLPEKLSNELCSLRPHEDKLTFSAIFTFDKNNKIHDRWFGKTIIHSDRRFTYEEAQQILETGQGEFASEIRYLNQVAKKLRKQKFNNGAINFETDEVKFKLDDEGKPIDIYVKERKDAHMLIEDFMLLANREVATFIHNKGRDQEIPYVYRVHDEPNPDKVEEFARFAKELGFQMNLSNPREVARSFNRLSEAAKTDPGLKLIEPLAIRTMAKAEYSTNNVGHYGLGFEYYAHFTSPIRRYSDVLAHRILESNLSQERFYRMHKDKLEEKCKHISIQERKALDAERESIKYKQVEFIENHVGEEFDGFVSGFIERGIFIELAGSKIEGMITFDALDEVFDLDASRLKATGFSSGRVIKVGDPVRVRIVRTDKAKRQVEMALAG